ncbi:MAG: hypothetical protein OXC40_01950 [Proteobacteria bacterium]|nr:hypothetical protein [Pseudomonadota bacterium]
MKLKHTHPIYLLIVMITLVVLSHSCKSLLGTSQNPKPPATLQSVVSTDYRVFLSEHKTKEGYFFFEVCHQVHQTCTNVFQVSPTEEGQTVRYAYFKIANIDEVKRTIFGDLDQETNDSLAEEIKILDQQLVKFKDQMKEQVKVAVQKYHQDPENFTRSQLVEHVDPVKASNLKKLRHIPQKLKTPEFLGTVAVMTYLSRATQVVQANPYTARARILLLEVPLLIGGAWAFFSGFDFFIKSMEDTVFDDAITRRERSLLTEDKLDELVEQRYGDKIKDHEQQIKQARQELITQMDEDGQAARERQDKYQLLINYFPAILDPNTTKTVPTNKRFMTLIAHLGKLLEQIVRADLAANNRTEDLARFKDKKIIAKMCFPDEEIVSELQVKSTKTLCYRIRH